MATSATIPVTVSPEARARVAELGLQKEFEQMLEQALRIVPELFCLRVELVEKDEDDDPAIVIWAHKALPSLPGPDRSDAPWDKWVIQTYPPEVHMHFVLGLVYGA